MLKLMSVYSKVFYMKNSTDKFGERFKKRLKDIFTANLSSKDIAVNFTIGILIGLLIPMGLQTIGVIALCTLFRLNFFIVVFATLITNPFTVVFIYYSAFEVGDYVLNSGITWSSISAVINNPELNSILVLSIESLKVIYLGLFIESIIFGVLTYILVYNFANYMKINRI
jgi:uncharacterized protein (DUF2062 family)